MPSGKLIITTLVPLLLLFSAMVQVSSAEGTRGEVGGFFSSAEIYSSSRSLSGGMDTGDPDNDGDIEVAFCDFEGNVILLEGENMDPVVIWQVEGPSGSNKTLFDIVVHDLDPDLPGMEIVTAGDAGPGEEKEVYLLHYDGSEWVSEVIYTGEFRTFDIEVGDIDPAPGDEILLSSFKHEEDYAIHYLYRLDGSWAAKDIPTTEAPKAASVADVDPDVPGVEVWSAVAGWNKEGGVESHLVMCYFDGSQWVEEIVFTNPTDLIANVKVGELLSTNPGNEIIIAELSGWCRYVYHNGTGYEVEDIFQSDTISGSPSGLEGLAIGDFNPGHPGDEAMVTGYYNKVTQIIEVDGELVSDLAWEKEVENSRLEISGVEVGDVLTDRPGNEVIIASLQGWIEVIFHQEDGLVLNVPLDEVEIDIGSSRNVFVEIIPRGYMSGPVVLSADPVSGLEIDVPTGLELEVQTILEVPIKVEVLNTFGDPREVTLSIDAVAGTFSNSLDVTIDVGRGGDTGVQLVVDPQIGRLYAEGGSTHISHLSLLNADEYDYLEISAGEVSGLQVYANTPIQPGQEQTITVGVVDDDPVPGTYTVPITISYNGLTVAQGSLLIEVLSMADSFTSSTRQVKGEDNMYLVLVEFGGPVDVEMVQVDIFVGEEKVFFDALDFSSGENFTHRFSADEDTGGVVRVELSTFGGDLIEKETLLDVKYKEESKDDDSPFLVYLAAAVILILIIVMALLFLFYKPSSDENTDLQHMGVPSRYSKGPRKVPISGRLDGRKGDVFEDIDERQKVRKGDMRRAPPRPKSMGPPPRDVRRAPPRRR